MYLCIIPSLLLIAVLLQYGLAVSRAVRMAVVVLAALSVLTATWSSLHEIRGLQVYNVSVPERLWSSLERSPPNLQAWCGSANPLTRGLCFLPDDDRIQTIGFMESHTSPGQRLYVGLTRHDRIFANDNIIYFAAERLPATKWSHLDPDLQSTYPIQAQMVRELEMNAPPYIVLDSEFDQLYEPNDSSRSSGVTLLDNYIRRNYQPVKTFGVMSVWQRR
jgi:hypothetical protein